MRRHGLWLCVAASVLLHAGVLALLPVPADVPRFIRQDRPIELRIREEPQAVYEPKLIGPKRRSSRPAVQEMAVEPPSAPAPAVPAATTGVDRPAIDLAAARALAMEIAREVQMPPEELAFERRRLDVRYVLARGIAQATVADCRSAYSGLLLLAVPMLVFDAFRDGGCRW